MRKFNKCFIKLLMVYLIIITLSIICKSNKSYRDIIYNNIFGSSINFSYARNFYNKYLGGVLNIKDFNNTKSVFNDKLKYYELTKYKDGVKLKVGYNYLVPVINSGIIVYIGNKDDYGNVIIIEDSNGVYNWYGNICNYNVKMYDNINSGDYIGEACDDYMYLVFTKGKQILDYKKFIN